MAAFNHIVPDVIYERLRVSWIHAALERNYPSFWIVTGIVSVSLLGLLNYLSGNEVDFSLFYLIPIALVTWVINQRAGLLLSFLSALVWLVAEFETGHAYAYPVLHLGNSVIRAGSFVICTYLLAQLQGSWRKEQSMARTDFVTGVANARHFHETLDMELERMRRYVHPVTVVYIDIDNFKLVNDLFGHQIGDDVLRCIAGELKSQLRSTDVIARLGGDEFGLLLPSTGQAEARAVISKLQTHLTQVMRRRNWPVTLSIGAMTCVSPPPSTAQILQTADRLMYEVKNSTKDAVRFGTWVGEHTDR